MFNKINGNLLTDFSWKQKLWKRSGCGAVGWGVASDTWCPRFESSHDKIYMFYQLYWKDKNKEKRKRGRKRPNFKKNYFCTSELMWHLFHILFVFYLKFNEKDCHKNYQRLDSNHGPLTWPWPVACYLKVVGICCSFLYFLRSNVYKDKLCAKSLPLLGRTTSAMYRPLTKKGMVFSNPVSWKVNLISAFCFTQGMW